MSPLAGFEVAQQKAADPDTNNLYYRQAKPQASLADLALPSFPQHYPQPGALARCVEIIHLGGLSTIAIFEHHAASPGGQLVIVRPAGYQDAIFLFMSITGMGQAIGQLAIVGEQDQAFTIDIQAADRIKLAGKFYQVAHRRTRVRSADGGEVAAWFV